MTEWAPATEAEAAMRDALRVDDQELYFRILARVELLLPISSEAIAGRAPMGWGTWTAGGRTHVLAFTSSEAMRACLAEHAGSARRIPYYELAAAWPNLEWWLAVNPGLPIEGYLPAWFVSQLARGDARLPGRSQEAPERRERAETLGRVSASARHLGMLLEGQLVGPPVTLPLPPAAAPGPLATGTAAAGTRVTGAVRPAAPEPGDFQPAPPLTETAPPRETPTQAPVTAPPGPLFEPANELEAQLLDAASAGSHDGFLSSLLLAKVLLPVAEGADPARRPGEEGFVWRTDKVDDQPQVVVFTSRERLAEQPGTPGEAIGIRFVQLIRAWPDETWSLAVNPGTPVGALLPGAQIIGLVSSAAEVGLGDDAGAAGESGAAASRAAGVTGASPAAGQPIPMQKVVAPSQLAWYLERSYDRVAGFVHREQEVAHLRSPGSLMRALGLRYEGSLFDSEASELYIIRWLAYHPVLYRIPYGGRTEAAMAAMEGWVIERPPFRGNGFAPAESEDVIAEFKVDSMRLPHGAQLWRLRADAGSQLVALLDSDGPTWRRVDGS